MFILTCKMCGGDLEVNANQTYGVCEHCGSKVTFPSNTDENKAKLFNNADRFRRQDDYDGAISAYEKILLEEPMNAEALWGLVISRHGIEYVVDPVTKERIPTCHRIQHESILSDPDYLSAVENAPDTHSKEIYIFEASRIYEIQKEFWKIADGEKPYDVFICYKETDENGNRTKDSTFAHDIYYKLVDEGFNVFFARITLEDKLGKQYEPYIFAALNSAKVLLAIGTCRTNFDAVWVKNEWSRFLKLMRKDKSKVLIPCYRDMDAYDLPNELGVLQSLDMSQIGFIQDLTRNIKKIVIPDVGKPFIPPGIDLKTEIDAIVTRGFTFLEDGEFQKASEYFNNALDRMPEHSRAYVGKLCVLLQCEREEDLLCNEKPLTTYSDFNRALRNADETYKSVLNGYNFEACQRIEESKRLERYNDAIMHKKEANSSSDYRAAAGMFRSLDGYKNSDEQANECDELAEKEVVKERKAQIDKDRQRKRLRRILAVVIACIMFTCAFSIVFFTLLLPFFKNNHVYLNAQKMAKEQKLIEAAKAYEGISDFKDSEELAQKMYLEYAQYCVENEDFDVALDAFESAGHYGNATEMISKTHYDKAARLFASGEFDGAAEEFALAGTYNDAGKKIFEAYYAKGEHFLEKKDFKIAAEAFASAAGFSDANERQLDAYYQLAQSLDSQQKSFDAIGFYQKALPYKDSAEKMKNNLSLYSYKIAAGQNHTVAVQSDGTVLVADEKRAARSAITGWMNCKAVAVGSGHTLGLLNDGTVIAAGDKKSEQIKVKGWTDIVQIAVGDSHSVGLKSDGTVVAVGDNQYGQCDVTEWRDIVAIAAGSRHTVGLTNKGRLVATGSNNNGQCIVDDAAEVTAISAGNAHTVALHADGTVSAYGSNLDGRCNVGDWENIVVVSAGKYHTVGLCADGKVVAVGYNDNGQCVVSGWKDIMAVSAGAWHTVGLRADGTVAVTGFNKLRGYDLSAWRLN